MGKYGKTHSGVRKRGEIERRGTTAAVATPLRKLAEVEEGCQRLNRGAGASLGAPIKKAAAQGSCPEFSGGTPVPCVSAITQGKNACCAMPFGVLKTAQGKFCALCLRRGAGRFPVARQSLFASHAAHVDDLNCPHFGLKCSPMFSSIGLCGERYRGLAGS